MQPTSTGSGVPTRRRSPWVVPLIVSGAVLLALVAAIVVVLVRGAAGGPTAPAACHVGTWTTTSYTEAVAITGVGDVTFTGTGTEVRLAADGTGVTDYKDGTAFTATVDGVPYRLVVTGRITYRYQVEGDRLRFSDVAAAGQRVVTRSDNGASLQRALTAELDPVTFRCTGDRMSQRTARYTAELRRLKTAG